MRDKSQFYDGGGKMSKKMWINIVSIYSIRETRDTKIYRSERII